MAEDYIEQNREIVEEAQIQENTVDEITRPAEIELNAGIGDFQKGIAQVVNSTYSFTQHSLFYALVPSWYRDFMWNYIRIACQWLDGYVPELHKYNSGIVSTRIGTKLITGLTKQVVGEKLVFKPNDKDLDKTRKTLRFITKWAREQNIIKAVYSSVGFALGIGTSLLKINKKADGTLWWEGVRFDNAFYLASFTNEVQEATFVIRNYADTRQNKSNQQFYLVEHRYYKICEVPEIVKLDDGEYITKHKKGDKVAMVEYKVHSVAGTILGHTLPSNVQSKKGINWEELPKEIRKNIKDDYGAIRVNEPQELGLSDLGVYPLLNAEIDLSIPTGTNFGEAMLVGVQSDLISYEIAESYAIRDMYLGKGAVYVPKSLNLGNTIFGGNVLQGVGEEKIERISGVDPEKQSIIVNQFNIRVGEWQQAKENALKSIAVKWGMTPKILASFLAQGAAQQTATQVDSEDDLAIAFIYHTRAYFKDTFNKALETTLNYYGYETNIEVDFASPSLLNKDRLLERVKNQLEIGVIDIEEAIRILNPDLDEEAIQAKVEIAKKNQEKLEMQGLTELDDEGVPNNIEYTEDILNGNGPIQKQ